MEYIEHLTGPPAIGATYLVPHVFGRAKVRNLASWWPVFLPPHEDSKYFPNNPWHYHTDPRFSPEFLMPRFDTVDKTDGQQVVVMKVKCFRSMPTIGAFFHAFGRAFADDFRGSNIRCGRCPHKGVSLSSVVPQGGVLRCPAHGLSFDPNTLECTLTEDI